MNDTARSAKVFVSHDWGANGETHRRVGKVVELLRDRGIEVWFDETHMKGNILDAMCEGIDSSDHVLCFITQAYIAKVQTGGDADNVRREFMYAQHKGKSGHIIPIRFDPHLPSSWGGPVGMCLGSHLYVDMR